MEDPIYKTLSSESESESVKLSVDKGGLFDSTTVFPVKGMSSENKVNSESMNKEESNEEVNGYIDISCRTPTNHGSAQLSESAKQKIYSPTLIESAIKVMKNLFSPEKVINKSVSVVCPNNKSTSASGSPSNSTITQGKADLFALDPENNIQSNIQLAQEEDSFKYYSQNKESETLQIPVTLDPLNNTDESFMTTVSLIDDSFHSAVTNLDEQGDFVRNCANLKDNILNDSRNFDLIDPANDTLENDSCLENTTIKIDSFSCDGNKLAGFSEQNKDDFIKSFSRTHTQEENIYFEDSGKLSVPQAQDGNHSSEKDSKSEVLGASDDINSEVIIFTESVGFHENKKEISVPSGIFNNENNIVESVKTPETSFAKPRCSEGDKIASNGLEKSTEKVEKFTIEETETSDQNKIHHKISSNEYNFVENSISTTTIVLNPKESADLDNMLMSLKADGSDTNISSLDDVIYSLENEVFESDTLSCDSSNIFPPNQTKRSCLSEGNSPSRSESTETKLNKSEELLNRRTLSEPFEKNSGNDKSVIDFSLLKSSDASEALNKSNNDKFSEVLNPGTGEVSPSLTKTDSVAVISQQSYTILNVKNKNLSRPVVEPLNVNDDLSEPPTFQKNDSDPTLSSESLVIEQYYVNNSSNGSIGSEELSKSSQVKQSTPLWEGNNENGAKFFRPTNLKLHSPESTVGDETKIIDNIEENNLLRTKAKQIFPNNDSIDGFSPVIPEGNDVFGNSVEDHTISTRSKINQSPQVKSQLRKSENSPGDASEVIFPNLNQTFDKKQQSLGSEEKFTVPLNQTFEKKSRRQDSDCQSRSSCDSSQTPKQDKLNVTFDINAKSSHSDKTFTKETQSPEIGEANLTFNKSKSPEPTLLNKTYDKSNSNQLNQTFNKKTKSFVPGKLNETFEKKSDTSFLGETFKVSDGILETSIQKESNQTVVVDSAYLEKDTQESNQTRETADNFGAHPVSKVDSILPEKDAGCIGASQKPDVNDSEFQLCSNFPATTALLYRNNNNAECDSSNDANESFVSTKSSNTSLFCSDISTVVFNEEDGPENRSIDELSRKLGKVDLNDDNKPDTELGFVPGASLPQGTSTVKEQNLQTEDNLSKDDKLRCDPDLVELIREQFSSNDIEKICSVVQDFSSVKLTNDIIKASEQFEKSFHGISAELPDDCNKQKVINALSPQSFDFLNSIGGKPTGRDLSRESLYVKFDPLVQPSANSLIDFTKEAEALAATEGSPVNANSSICEQLLTISPQKKPDAIVPPLTPLSHKTKRDSNEDKLERLNELQNEIYFLKNLYAERERSNRTKMEEYENQIAKLTGESCMLEDKLKESNEREKSLVKKIREQTQSIGQLKIIMEEYVKVISKLSSELETIKNENLKQLETLSLERDSYVTHLQNTEAAFTDVHAKYEKSKKTIVNLKANETLFRSTIAEQTQKMEEFKSKAKEAQEKALMGFQKIQEELNQSKADHSQEVARLKAQLRKTELKVEALQESLDQKIKENQQLTAICDELIEGKK